MSLNAVFSKLVFPRALSQKCSLHQTLVLFQSLLWSFLQKGLFIYHFIPFFSVCWLRFLIYKVINRYSNKNFEPAFIQYSGFCSGNICIFVHISLITPLLHTCNTIVLMYSDESAGGGVVISKFVSKCTCCSNTVYEFCSAVFLSWEGGGLLWVGVTHRM